MDRRLLAYKYDTDKSQLYLNNYERHFKALADQATKLLELGIHRGGSLLMWRDFFPNGDIVGLDVERVVIDDPTGRIHTHQGDQRDLDLLDRMAAQWAPSGFDVVIDDASHIAQDTRTSFWHLFERHLRPGGIYVIEDWRVGYWEAWPDGVRYESPSSRPRRNMLLGFLRRSKRNSLFESHSHGMVGLVKQLVDELGIDAITSPARSGRSPQRFPRFQRIEICPGQVFVFKTTKEDDDLVAAQLRGAPKRD